LGDPTAYERGNPGPGRREKKEGALSDPDEQAIRKISKDDRT